MLRKVVLRFTLSVALKIPAKDSIFVTLLKVPLHQRPRRAWEEPTSGAYGSRPANDETQNMICSENTVCAETRNENMTSHFLTVFSQIPVLNQIRFRALSFAGQPWYIALISF